MKILVTGGFGFIGAHLVDALLALGHDVRILDNRSQCYYGESGFPGFMDNPCVEIIKGDITDLGTCLRVSSGMDAIFHAAAIVLVRESYEAPERTAQINIQGTENMLKAALKHQINRFIYSSTGKIYGDHENPLSKETDSLDPGTIYAKTKCEAEKIVQDYAQKHGLNIHSLRYFSIYGPHMKLFGGMIGDILKSTMNGGISTINASPSMARDFTYIGDAVQANLLCLLNPVCGYEAFNIGAGQVTTIEELINVIQFHCEKHLHVNFDEILEGTVFRTGADISKARTILGYDPKIDLAAGLRETFKWIKDYDLLVNH